MPAVTDRPAVFNAKLTFLEKELKRLKKRQLENLTMAGRNVEAFNIKEAAKSAMDEAASNKQMKLNKFLIGE